MNRKSRIYIGTSGWHYEHWIGPFYPEKVRKKDFLNYYVKHLGSVEINNSFYRMPKSSTMKDWHDSTPDDFLFTIKASRYITHVKKLKDPQKGVVNFIKIAKMLKKKLGPILFQLPPGWKCNKERLRSFLEFLDPDYEYVFEFRNHDWFNEDVYYLLKKHKCAFCLYELEGQMTPQIVTADSIYIRLHGPGKAYEGSYDQRGLKSWAEKIGAWRNENKTVYIYFDNDQEGYAIKNALELEHLLDT